jgi:uroporphyrinogen decarboxylase
MQVKHTGVRRSPAGRIAVGGDKVHNPHGGGNTYQLERVLGEDMLLTSVGWANSYYQEADTYTDEWGIAWKSQEYETPFGKGRYTEIASHPLADDKAILDYQVPIPAAPKYKGQPG